MRTWTIILAAATLLLASCSEEDIKPDETLTGSISHSYTHIQSKMYLDGVALELSDWASIGFGKLSDTHVDLIYAAGNDNGSVSYYGLYIESLEVHGRPYDVSFDYYSEARNDKFRIENEEYYPIKVKVEGGLYNYLAEVVYTPSFTTRDWSPPGYEGDLKITVLLEDAREYRFEITRI